MKTDNTPYDVLVKELSGSASESDKALIKEWLDTSPEARETYASFTEIWEQQYFEHENSQLINQEEIGNKVWNAVFEPPVASRTSWIKINFNNFLKVAAVLVVITSAAIFSGVFSPQEKTSNQPITRIIEKQTLPGQKSTVTLPDGSIVSLNSGSKIRYASDFAQGNRDIYLEGQAFFDVFENPESPFVVTCRNTQVEALGTSFDVDAFSEGQVRVSLVTGKVKLSAAGTTENMLLLPGQFSIVRKDNTMTEAAAFVESDVLAWKNGKMIFRELTLEEIIPTLELWYGVKILNQTKIKSKHFYGTFEKESLDNVLHNIGLSMGFSYEFQGDTVVLK